MTDEELRERFKAISALLFWGVVLLMLQIGVCAIVLLIRLSK